MSIEERKTIVNKLIHGAKYRFRVCVENKYWRSEPFRQYKTTTCHIQWTPLTDYFIECRLQEISHWSKVTKQIISSDTN
ncbi:unnamed protein product [Rotaria sordida]|uniref:Uncharacterized protein n=1 Tax=Rotaria sordida TaxID=392033 RepID=A0A815IEP7_9BILA|nr:unnamed protein product [Rotaria sordida]